jgi:phosphoribosylanthranilate isomerase
MLKVKVCGMRETLNLLALDALQPDMVGINFYESSPRFAGYDYLPPDGLRAMKVGVFVNAAIEMVERIAQSATLDFLQLHGNEPVALCEELYQKGYKIIKAFSIGRPPEWEPMELYLPYCEYFLFDTATKSFGGSGQQFDWSMLNTYPYKKPLILSGGIDLADVERIKALNMPALTTVDINSRFEVNPGLKDIHKIKKFIHGIRN